MYEHFKYTCILLGLNLHISLIGKTTFTDSTRQVANLVYSNNVMGESISPEEKAARSIGAVSKDDGLYLNGVKLALKNGQSGLVWITDQLMNLVETNPTFCNALDEYYDAQKKNEK